MSIRQWFTAQAKLIAKIEEQREAIERQQQLIMTQGEQITQLTVANLLLAHESEALVEPQALSFGHIFRRN